VAKAAQFEFDDGQTVAIPVGDVDWLASELRRSVEDDLASLERPPSFSRVASPTRPSQTRSRAAVIALLRRHLLELSEPLRRLHHALRNELNR
jgi:hypothetical protein